MKSNSKEINFQINDKFSIKLIQLFASLWVFIAGITSLGVVAFASLNPWHWLWLIPYLIYIIFDDTPETGGRKISWLYNCSLYEHIRNYFQMAIVKSQNLNPENNYIFGYHPHGIIAYGAQAALRSNCEQFADLFPGIDLSPTSCPFNFRVPFSREIGMGLGFVSVSKRSIMNVVKPGSGRSVAIVVGGGAEAVYATDEHSKLLLKKKLGFVKIAIQTGAHLVPVYGFGETSIFSLFNSFDIPHLAWVRKLLCMTGMEPALFYGRGIAEGSVGLFPYRKQITLVVGKSVPVIQNDRPSQRELEEVHQQYLKNLKEVYDQFKNLYHVGPLPAPELEFI